MAFTPLILGWYRKEAWPVIHGRVNSSDISGPSTGFLEFRLPLVQKKPQHRCFAVTLAVWLVQFRFELFGANKVA
jgi:hypothetical protein